MSHSLAERELRRHSLISTTLARTVTLGECAAPAPLIWWGFDEGLIKIPHARVAGATPTTMIVPMSPSEPRDLRLEEASPIARTAVGLRAMVVEDERELADLIGTYLSRDGFDITIVNNGQDAVDLIRGIDPDVVVLDLGLPGLDGVEVCRQLRTFSDAYVVMLTARTEEVDTLIGLSVGADDYMTKPFSPRELMARIQVMLRRPRSSTAFRSPSAASQRELRKIGALAIDVDGREVTVGNIPVQLTRTEFDLLVALIRDPGVVLSRTQLIKAIWGPDWVGDTHLVDVHIGHLRRKLGDTASRGAYIRTVRGVGYRTGDGQ